MFTPAFAFLAPKGLQRRIANTTANHYDTDLFREQGVEQGLIFYANTAREAAERLLGRQPDLIAITMGKMK